MMHVEAEEGPEDVIKTLGFDRKRVYPWMAAYKLDSIMV
jgi:hypothetical protein